MTKLLAGPGVAAFNRHGIAHLSDDVAALQQFAVRHRFEGAHPPLHGAQELLDAFAGEDWGRLSLLQMEAPHVDPLQARSLLAACVCALRCSHAMPAPQGRHV